MHGVADPLKHPTPRPGLLTILLKSIGNTNTNTAWKKIIANTNTNTIFLKVLQYQYQYFCSIA